MKHKLISFLGVVGGMIAGAVYTYHKEEEKVEKTKIQSDRNMAMYRLMNEWMQLRQEGKRIDCYLLENGYRNIAIYGMGYLGMALLRDLQETDVNVVYAIDKKVEERADGIRVISPDDELPEVDAIIVTPFNAFDDIEEVLVKRTECPILSIDDIIFDI